MFLSQEVKLGQDYCREEQARSPPECMEGPCCLEKLRRKQSDGQVLPESLSTPLKKYHPCLLWSEPWAALSVNTQGTWYTDTTQSWHPEVRKTMASHCLPQYRTDISTPSKYDLSLTYMELDLC